MRVLLFGERSSILSNFLGKDHEIVMNSPDVVVSFGGDGTLLKAERTYPGVPKIVLRNSKICKQCSNLSYEEISLRLSRGEFVKNSLLNLSVTYEDTECFALNDCIIAHAKPNAALRFLVSINERPYASGREIVGDGIVVATPFGSGAYYRSITDSVFCEGIGLAFNNTTEQVDHIVLKEGDAVTFELTRGEALCAVDAENPIQLSQGEHVTIRASSRKSSLITFDESFCYWCASR